MASWILAIDFGTSYTVAAVRVDDRPPEVIEDGGERRVPSVVLIDGDAGILVGRPADDLSVTHPGNTLRAIKNRLGDQSPVILGGRPYQIVNLVAALLSDVYVQIVEQMGGEPPTEVRLTHPATWSLPRMNRLLEAAAKAELPNTVLVPEPVAAALSYATDVGLPSGRQIVVYDLGGGTFDSAVVASRDGEFVIVGRPTGDQNIGGELFDEMLVNHIGEQLDPEVWDSILIGESLVWQQVGVTLRNEARRAKEALSSHPYVNVIVPLPTAGLWQVRLTRAEFDDLVRPFINETIALLQRCVQEADLGASDLAGISLVGGSSRSPIVQEMVAAAFPDVPVSRRGDPKAVVAAGATRALGPAVARPLRRHLVDTKEAAAGTAPQPVRLAPPASLADPVSDPGSDPVSEPRLESAPPATAPVVEREPSLPLEREPPLPLEREPAAPTVVAEPGPVGPPALTPGRRSRRAIAVGVGLAVVAGIAATVFAINAGSDDPGETGDSEHGAEIATLAGHEAGVWSAEFSPDGAKIVTASADATAKVWDVLSGDELLTLANFGAGVNGAAFNPDGSRIVTAGDDGMAKVWDVANGNELVTLDGHGAEVRSAVFSPDGTRIVTASFDQSAKIWDSSSGQELYALGHEDGVLRAAFSPDGAHVVTASFDDTAKIWDATTGEEVALLSGHDNSVIFAAFSPDGNRVVTASDDGTAKVWDAASGEELLDLIGHSDSVWSAAFSPDGTRIVTASGDGTAKVWDAENGDDLWTLAGHDATVVWAEFSPDGATIVTASEDATGKIWDAESGEDLATLEGHSEPVVRAEFSPDGSMVVTASDDGTARIWDA